MGGGAGVARGRRGGGAAADVPAGAAPHRRSALHAIREYPLPDTRYPIPDTRYPLLVVLPLTHANEESRQIALNLCYDAHSRTDPFIRYTHAHISPYRHNHRHVDTNSYHSRPNTEHNLYRHTHYYAMYMHIHIHSHTLEHKHIHSFTCRHMYRRTHPCTCTLFVTSIRIHYRTQKYLQIYSKIQSYIKTHAQAYTSHLYTYSNPYTGTHTSIHIQYNQYLSIF